MWSSGLPHEIIIDILVRLPVKSLLRFRCVCKLWCTLVTDPNFIKMHLKQTTENNNPSLLLRACDLPRGCDLYTIDYDESCDEAVAVEIEYPFKSPDNGYVAEILGSSNGVLCINTGVDDTDNHVICLWNPSTKEYKKLPSAPIEFPGGPSRVKYGFGYDPILDDYKVVRLVYFFDEDDDILYDSEVKVYTLGTDSWRMVQDIPYLICYESMPGVLVNGALHWVMADVTAIVSFDIGNEEYREVPQPDYFDDKFDIELGVLEGCLYILGGNYYNSHCEFCNSHIELWVMKDYGVTESWTKLFTFSELTVIRPFDFLKPLLFSQKAEILLEKDNQDLVLYGPERGRAKNLKIRGIRNQFRTETYLGSLVSLKSGTYVGQGNAINISNVDPCSFQG